jgi:uncharacterized protein YidB (DUF937 family)
MLVKDERPYIEVKKARIARAGPQLYSAMEIAARGGKSATDKQVYVEYRPPEVLLRNLDKFNMIALTNDHPPVDVTAENWHDYVVGFVGSSASVEVLDTGEIFVVNDIAFYDRRAYDDYKAGKVEISAGYVSETTAVKDPDKVGYDFVMRDITTVNHAALCDTARAGHNARVLDSINAAEMARILNGEGNMGAITSLLTAFGIGKVKDSAFSLSKAVMDSLAKVAAMDAAALKEGLASEVTAVMQHLTPLGTCEAKGTLVATVADSFKNAKEVLEKKDEIGKVIDALYVKCLDEDKKAAQAVLDAITGKQTDSDDAKKKAEEEAKKKAEEEAKKKEAGGVKDSAAIIDEAVKTAMSGVTDSVIADLTKQLPGLVDAAVKKSLGQEPGGGGSVDNRTLDALDSLDGLGGDASFLLKGAFPVTR